MMKQRHLVSIFLSVILIGVLYGVYGIWSSYKARTVVYVGNPDDTLVTASPQDTLGIEQVELPTETSSSLRLSYAKARTLYKDRMVTFDTSCRAMPFTMTVPYQGTIMLDNRSDQPREIGIGTRRININPLDFFVTTITRHGDLTVSCDGLENVAVIGVTE